MGVSSQVGSEEELREASAEIRGSLVEWKVKAEAWHTKGSRRVLAHFLIFSASKRS